LKKNKSLRKNHFRRKENHLRNLGKRISSNTGKGGTPGNFDGTRELLPWGRKLANKRGRDSALFRRKNLSGGTGFLRSKRSRNDHSKIKEET